MAKRSLSSIAIGTISSTVHLHVVARHHHLGAFRQLHDAGHVGRAEVELRTVVGEERRVTAALFLGQDVGLGLELRVRRDRARLAQHLAALDALALDAAEQAPTLSPAWPWSSSLRNISTPVTTVFVVARMPTISTSSPTLTMPRSTRPVTTVPRPEIENTSSIGIRNGLSIGRSGCRDVVVDRLHQLEDGVLADLRRRRLPGLRAPSP